MIAAAFALTFAGAIAGIAALLALTGLSWPAALLIAAFVLGVAYGTAEMSRAR